MMSSQEESQSPPAKRVPPPPPKRRGGARLASPPSFQKYLMNDIPRGTSKGKLINSLLTPSHGAQTATPEKQPQVQFGLEMTESRLDDELSVAVIEFSDTPKWLLALNLDPCGFPKKTILGTLWRAVDSNAVDERGQTELIRAVIGGRPNLLYAEMLAEFADTNVNIQDNEGRSALHWACVGNQVDMVALFLSVPDCVIGLRDKDNLTAFDISLRGGNEIIAALFYQTMFELEEQDPPTALLRLLTVSSAPTTDKPIFPGSAMFQPVEDCNLPLVEALIHRRIDLTATNMDGNTVLHVAAAIRDNVEIATKLLEAGSDVNAIGHKGATPLHCAAYAADASMVQVLLGWEADPTVKDSDDRSALDWAAKHRHLHAAQLLLAQGADGGEHDGHGPSVPDQVVKREDNEMVVLLEEVTNKNPTELDLIAVRAQEIVVKVPQADIELKNKDGRTPLLQAVYDRDQEAVRKLLELGANTEATDTDQCTALHLAAMNGDTGIIEILLASGAQIESITLRKNKPLHLAARNGHTEIVKILLAGGALVDTQDVWDETALHDAARNGNTETVKTLLTAGANTEAQGKFGTPLHVALKCHKWAAVETLLASGAQTEAVGNLGRTELHVAAENGDIEIVTVLLAAGVRADFLGPNGTALQVAASNGHWKIVKLLRAAEAHSTVGRLRYNALDALRLSGRRG